MCSESIERKHLLLPAGVMVAVEPLVDLLLAATLSSGLPPSRVGSTYQHLVVFLSLSIFVRTGVTLEKG